MAKKIGENRSTYANWESEAEPSMDQLAKIGKVVGYKVNQLLDENFIEKFKLEESEANYKTRKKEVKKIDADTIIAHDNIQIKAMLRVLLRSTASQIAAQKKIHVNLVLDEMTKAVRAETLGEFDAL